MARLTSAFLGAVLASSSAVRAWSDIEVADTVQADTATTVLVDFDSDATGYVIYLATTPPGWGTGPVCWLVNSTDASVTSVDLTIPASVVPDGSVVSLAYSELEYFSDDDSYGSSSYGYSNDFEFEGGTGEWSALELNGYGISSPDSTPCTALQCIRDCGNKYYPDGDLEDDSDFYDTYKSYYNCADACPGTTYPPYDEVMGDDGDGDYATASASGSPTYYETGSATASATASATSGSSTLSSAKATGTSSSSSSSSETAATKSASSAASSTSTVTTSSASRTGLTATAVLLLCAGLFLRM